MKFACLDSAGRWNEGVFVGWRKRDGDRVNVGEVIFELEGEKASQEIEAIDEGILRIPPEGPKEGAVVLVGALLGYLVSEGETFVTPASAPLPANPQVVDKTPAKAVVNLPRGENRAIATPRARRAALESGIGLARAYGYGSRRAHPRA